MVSVLRPFFPPKLYHLLCVHIRKSDDLDNDCAKAWLEKYKMYGLFLSSVDGTRHHHGSTTFLLRTPRGGVNHPAYVVRSLTLWNPIRYDEHQEKVSGTTKGHTDERSHCDR